MSSTAKSFWLNYEKDYNRQTTPHITYMCTYTHTRLQNKITNITQTNKLHKTNSRKICGVIVVRGRYL